MEEKIKVRPCTRGGERRKSSDFSEILSPEEELLNYSGLSSPDFSTLSKLELKINSEEMSLHKFGSICPNLSELKLSGSNIPSIRELGTDWSNLEVLWLVRSNLNDIDGISAFPKLKELFCAFNNISSLSGLMFHDSLQILDLEGNKIADFSEVETLQFCYALVSVNFEGNPLSFDEDYRGRVFKALSGLKLLDDLPVDASVDGKVDQQEIDIINNSVRESSVVRNKSQMSTRPSSAKNVFQDEASLLTEQVFTGNPLKAMRFRRKKLFEGGGNDDFMELVREFKVEAIKVPRKKSARPKVIKENNIMIRSVGKEGFYETR
jgi:Leucine-rich repeat (LRR) protein